MKEPRGIKTRRILNALLAGKVLTPYDANEIGKLPMERESFVN